MTFSLSRSTRSSRSAFSRLWEPLDTLEDSLLAYDQGKLTLAVVGAVRIVLRTEENPPEPKAFLDACPPGVPASLRKRLTAMG